jgi:hypothetical protein
MRRAEAVVRRREGMRRTEAVVRGEEREWWEKRTINEEWILKAIRKRVRRREVIIIRDEEKQKGKDKEAK